MNIYKSVVSLLKKLNTMFNHIEQLKEIASINYIENFKNDLKISQPNSLLHDGFSVYSQNDEDGIIQIIFKKIGKEKINFVEFGVEPSENNTNLLLLSGSQGVWIDKSLTLFKKKYCQKPSSNLMVLDESVTKDNITELMQKSLNFLQADNQSLDFLSIDLDGNDFHFLS